MLSAKSTALALAVPAISLTIWRTYRLVANYFEARKTGLPLVVLLASWQDPLWMLYLHNKFKWLSRLPFGLGQWVRFSYLGWSLHDRYECHKQLGDAFVLVSPSKNEIMVADADATAEILTKYHKWIRPKDVYTLFELFGPNVDSVNGRDWQRHRKVVNHGFREENVRLAWAAGLKQARQMADSIDEEITLKQLAWNFQSVAINILSYAGFGHDYDFGRPDQTLTHGHRTQFSDALLGVCTNMLPAWIFKNIGLSNMLLPVSIRKIKSNMAELTQYFDESLVEMKGDFVQSIVKANETSKITDRLFLNQEEIYGNLFVIQLAGFETTSNSLLFSLALLSAHLDVQEWVRQSFNENYEYDQAFPNARCMAVMYETLRVYGVAPVFTRIAIHDETISIAGKNVTIPVGTLISANPQALHHNPKFWGHDVAEWKPSRWIESVDGIETLRRPPSDQIFTAWSIGPRSCPGKKFSQAEFTSVLSVILSTFDVVGSSNMQSTLDDFIFDVGPKPKQPQNARLRFVRRSPKNHQDRR